jgi:hypothetical protein
VLGENSPAPDFELTRFDSNSSRYWTEARGGVDDALGGDSSVTPD